MADFSELCPLFNIGVFNETTFPVMYLTAQLPSANLLAGSCTVTGTTIGYFKFGRTVVVSSAFIKREVAVNTTEVELNLGHLTSVDAAYTVFGVVTLPVSASQYEIGYSWVPVTISAAKTFTSDEVLFFGVNAALTVSSGAVALMVRYKEK